MDVNITMFGFKFVPVFLCNKQYINNKSPYTCIFLLLFRVLAFSRKNLMSTQGIGIVFGPTLMWPELDAGNMAVNMVYQNQIVEFILIESREIFNLDRK
uniref:Rho-GAP domain-containing protein n=1 Tax=Seriola lalandi dorsalis TaxID=1841481 RepID=A0A3B4WHL8_SERLL